MNPERHMREKRGVNYILYNTLNCVPQLLIGYNTIVDLRNETSVAGHVDHVDGYRNCSKLPHIYINSNISPPHRFMNIDMTNAVFIDQQLQQHPFDLFHIPARNVRYIHIPDDVNTPPLSLIGVDLS